MENKNIYLLKMGADTDGGLNHRIRFQSKKTKIDKNIKFLCIDFLIASPLKYEKGKYKSVKNKKSLCFDIYTHYNNICYRGKLPESVINALEKYPDVKTNNIVYNYNNILMIINYFLNENYNNIVLLEIKNIKNFSFETFESDFETN